MFPLIPEELGVDPLLLTVLHATVFLSGSDDAVVNPDAAVEALEYMAAYMQRLEGDRLRKVQEDLNCLTSLARREKWSKQVTQFLKTVLSDFGVGRGGEA